jgi:hypothetical protein
MEQERTRALVGECISRLHVEAARGATLADIEAACAACDYERAATYVLGRARAGEVVPLDVIVRVLPGIEMPPITLALIAAVKDDRARLIELLERRKFRRTRDGGDLEAIVLFAAWRAGAETARVIPELRRLSARMLSAESYALLATIAAAIADPNVAAATKPIAPLAKQFAKQVAADDKTLKLPVEHALAELPAEIDVPAAAGFTVVRLDKQVGRNDPCPCGSGLKYKKCCADKAQHIGAPSPIPGVSYEQFLGASADRITHEHIAELSLRDLARVDITRLRNDSLRVACRCMFEAHEWAHAERMLDELERRPHDETGDYPEGAVTAADDFRFELVMEALDCGEIELARKHIARLPVELAKDFVLDVAIADGPEPAWQALNAAARAALATGEPIPDIDLAYTLLRAAPALGIYFARACIGTLHVDDAETLLEAVEEARDELNLAPDDPAWSVLDQLIQHEEQRPKLDEAKLDAEIADRTARINELESKLAAARTRLDQASTRPAAELTRTPEQRGSVDDRVAELEALIREGNAERRELRKRLEAAATEEPARREGPRARRVTMEETDDDVGDDIEVGTRGITIPRFERRVIDALADVPAAVAAETMRTIGTLAAGDGFAWRSVKQAKDMVRPVLMARVGIHHRLLFRVDAGALEVVDLITREQLLTTLKRLRSGR